jgi:hypothetical protein
VNARRVLVGANCGMTLLLERMYAGDHSGSTDSNYVRVRLQAQFTSVLAEGMSGRNSNNKMPCWHSTESRNENTESTKYKYGRP